VAQLLVEVKGALREALENDLALYSFWPVLLRFCREVKKLLAAGRLSAAEAAACRARLDDMDARLGILDRAALPLAPERWPAEAAELVARRQAARAARDYAEADALRAALAALGSHGGGRPRGTPVARRPRGLSRSPDPGRGRPGQAGFPPQRAARELLARPDAYGWQRHAPLPGGVPRGSMVKKASRDYHRRPHSLSATVRRWRRLLPCRGPRPEDFLRPGRRGAARLRTLLDAGPAPLDGAAGAARSGRGGDGGGPGLARLPDAPAMAGLEEDAASRYVASGTEVVRAQTRELDNFKQRLAEDWRASARHMPRTRSARPPDDGFPAHPGRRRLCGA
jgi:hypothetical protein